MAGRAIRRPSSFRTLGPVQVDDPQTARALDQVSDAVQSLQASRSRVVVTQDLVIGTNKVRHGLGRAAAGYTLVATVADAAFAHAISDSNPRPDLEVWVTVVGAAQPGARVEVW
jgi:hypothetical protein